MREMHTPSAAGPEGEGASAASLGRVGGWGVGLRGGGWGGSGVTLRYSCVEARAEWLTARHRSSPGVRLLGRCRFDDPMTRRGGCGSGVSGSAMQVAPCPNISLGWPFPLGLVAVRSHWP